MEFGVMVRKIFGGLIKVPSFLSGFNQPIRILIHHPAFPAFHQFHNVAFALCGDFMLDFVLSS